MKALRATYDIIAISSTDEYASRELAHILCEMLEPRGDSAFPVSFGEVVWATLNSLGQQFTPNSSPTLNIDEPIPDSASALRAWDIYTKLREQLLAILGPKPFCRVVDDFLDFNPSLASPLFIFFDVSRPEFLETLKNRTAHDRILHLCYEPSAGPILPWVDPLTQIHVGEPSRVASTILL